MTPIIDLCGPAVQKALDHAEDDFSGLGCACDVAAGTVGGIILAVCFHLHPVSPHPDEPDPHDAVGIDSVTLNLSPEEWAALKAYIDTKMNAAIASGEIDP